MTIFRGGNDLNAIAGEVGATAADLRDSLLALPAPWLRTDQQDTIDTGVAEAPFVLGTDNQGQLVTGFNADQLDGQEGSYYTDADNLVIDDAGGHFSATNVEAALDEIKTEGTPWVFKQSATYSDADTLTADTTTTDDAGEYVFHVGCRVRVYLQSSDAYRYGTITALGTRGASGTVDIAFDSGSLANETLTVWVGQASALDGKQSIPAEAVNFRYGDTDASALSLAGVLELGAVNALWFDGVVGDDSNDDTTGIQNAADTGKSIVFPQTSVAYRIASTVTLSSDKQRLITQDGAKIHSVVPANDPTFLFTGSAGALYDITSDITAGDTSFFVSAGDSSNVSAGDVIKIKSDELYHDSPTRNYQLGELVVVSAVDTGTGEISVEGNGIALDYTSSGFTLQAQVITTLEDVGMEGMELYGDGGGSDQVGVRFLYCDNPVMRGCKVRDFNVGITPNACRHAVIANCHVHDCDSGGTGIGYGIAIAGSSQNTIVSNNTFEQNRHSVTTSGNDGVVMGVGVYNNTVTNHPDSAALDTHGNARFVEFVGNIVLNAQRGIQTRSPNTLIADNYIYNIDQIGIYAIEAGGINCTVRGNVVERTTISSQEAILIQVSATVHEQNRYVAVDSNSVVDTLNGNAIFIAADNPQLVRVTNNTITNTYNSAIVANDGEQFIVRGNIIFDGTVAAKPAIDITGTASGSLSTLSSTYGSTALIADNNVARYKDGITVDDIDTLKIDNNILNVGTKFSLTNIGKQIINGLGVESRNAETPNAANWQPGNYVEFTDSGDGSGDGVQLLLSDGTTWTTVA